MYMTTLYTKAEFVQGSTFSWTHFPSLRIFVNKESKQLFSKSVLKIVGGLNFFGFWVGEEIDLGGKCVHEKSIYLRKFNFNIYIAGESCETQCT